MPKKSASAAEKAPAESTSDDLFDRVMSGNNAGFANEPEAGEEIEFIGPRVMRCNKARLVEVDQGTKVSLVLDMTDADSGKEKSLWLSVWYDQNVLTPGKETALRIAREQLARCGCTFKSPVEMRGAIEAMQGTFFIVVGKKSKDPQYPNNYELKKKHDGGAIGADSGKPLADSSEDDLPF